MPEIIIVILSILVLIFDIVIYIIGKEPYETENIAMNGDTRLVMPNFFKFIIILLTTSISVIIYLKMYRNNLEVFSLKTNLNVTFTFI